MMSRNRPLSPHMQVYRLPVLAWVSITHRWTGMLLSAGTILLAYWLGSASMGPEAFARANAFMASPVGIVLLLTFTFSLFYHLSNGIRHLAWDVGLGFELRNAYLSGYAVIAVALLLTALTWIIGLSV